MPKHYYPSRALQRMIEVQQEFCHDIDRLATSILQECTDATYFTSDLEHAERQLSLAAQLSQLAVDRYTPEAHPDISTDLPANAQAATDIEGHIERPELKERAYQIRKLVVNYINLIDRHQGLTPGDKVGILAAFAEELDDILDKFSQFMETELKQRDDDRDQLIQAIYSYLNNQPNTPE